MDRICLGCKSDEVATVEEFPALCAPCMARIGDGIEPGAQVICEVDDSCSGEVKFMADEELAVIETRDGCEAWVPVVELVRVGLALWGFTCGMTLTTSVMTA